MLRSKFAANAKEFVQSIATAIGLNEPQLLYRTSYLYDHVNLPAVINYMAVNTLLGNMDRCTKNFYVYYNPDTAEWYM